MVVFAYIYCSVPPIFILFNSVESNLNTNFYSKLFMKISQDIPKILHKYYPFTQCVYFFSNHLIKYNTLKGFLIQIFPFSELIPLQIVTSIDNFDGMLIF